jgi:hypothetical protein
MDGKAMTRKDFITLTLTLIGSTAAVAASCSDDNTSTNNSGTGGTTANNTGVGGTTGSAGTSSAGTTGQGGSGTVVACADPLTEAQLPDTNGHVHSVTVPAATLLARSDQTITTSPAGDPAHMHNITLTTADLATLAGGGSVTVTSTPTLSHMHQYMVSCH